MRIYLMLDSTRDRNDKEWVEKELNKLGYNVTVQYTPVVLSELVRSRRLARGYWIQIKQVIEILYRSNVGDTIICWYSVTGVLLNFFSRILGNKRKLILLNWLTPASRKRPIDIMYKYVITNPQARILINCKSTKNIWIKHLSAENSVNADFYFNPDVYDDKCTFVEPVNKQEKYIFVGGVTNRDWILVNKIAKNLPNFNFLCCALQHDFETVVHEKSPNITTYFNVSFESYYELMTHATISLIPLKTDAVSGLVTILKTIQLGVPCIVSNTEATLQYFTVEDRKLTLCDKKLESWTIAINTIMSMTDLHYRNFVAGLQAYILDNFSPSRSANTIIRAINE